MACVTGQEFSKATHHLQHVKVLDYDWLACMTVTYHQNSMFHVSNILWEVEKIRETTCETPTYSHLRVYGFFIHVISNLAVTC